MRLYIAPMEGITDHVFRCVHHRYFPGADKYYTPFFSPTADGRFTGRSLRDLDPELNRGLPAVPQLLTRHSADFLWAAKALADMGYPEINLNLGCPSGTVVAKGKGSGLLDRPEELKALLDGIFDYPLKAEVSVKTRLGRKDPEEFPKLLELFDQYPISELTIHCRVRDDLYRRPAQPQAFALPLRESKTRCATTATWLRRRRLRTFRPNSRRPRQPCWAGAWWRTRRCSGASRAARGRTERP